MFRLYLRLKPSWVWWNLWSADGNVYLTINLKDCPTEKLHMRVCCWASLWNQLQCLYVFCYPQVPCKRLSDFWGIALMKGWYNIHLAWCRHAEEGVFLEPANHRLSRCISDGLCGREVIIFQPLKNITDPISPCFMICRTLPQWQWDGVSCICLILHNEDQMRPVRKTTCTRPDNK